MECNGTLKQSRNGVNIAVSVTPGQRIATIGNANGAYPAHLHFELRDKVGIPLGKGYSRDKTGYINGTKFIKTLLLQ